jgi:hypothetical protein
MSHDGEHHFKCLFPTFLLLCWVGVHYGIHKSSYNITNISYLNSFSPSFSFIPSSILISLFMFLLLGFKSSIVFGITVLFQQCLLQIVYPNLCFIFSISWLFFKAYIFNFRETQLINYLFYRVWLLYSIKKFLLCSLSMCREL